MAGTVTLEDDDKRVAKSTIRYCLSQNDRCGQRVFKVFAGYADSAAFRRSGHSKRLLTPWLKTVKHRVTVSVNCEVYRGPMNPTRTKVGISMESNSSNEATQPVMILREDKRPWVTAVQHNGHNFPRTSGTYTTMSWVYLNTRPTRPYDFLKIKLDERPVSYTRGEPRLSCPTRETFASVLRVGGVGGKSFPAGAVCLMRDNSKGGCMCTK